MKTTIQNKKEEFTRQRDELARRAEALDAQARELRKNIIAYGGAIQACDQLLAECESSSSSVVPSP